MRVRERIMRGRDPIVILYLFFAGALTYLLAHLLAIWRNGDIVFPLPSIVICLSGIIIFALNAWRVMAGRRNLLVLEPPQIWRNPLADKMICPECGGWHDVNSECLPNDKIEQLR